MVWNPGIMNLRVGPEVDALFREAVACQGRGELAQAAHLYERVLAMAPAHFDALHLLGVTRHQAGDHEAAVAHMTRAIAINPSQAAVRSNLGLALEALGRPTEALESHDIALALDSGFAEALNNRGNVLRLLGRAGEALESYDRALAVKPDFPGALNNRGIALRDLNCLHEALASYDQALILNPDYRQALMNRGIALLDMERPAEAVECFDRVIFLDPEDPAAHCNRGNSLQSLNRSGEALASYDRAVELEPAFAEAFNNRGNTLRILDRPHEALESINRALALKPDFVEALNNRGIALRDLDRPREAIESFEKALQIDPVHPDSLCNRGNALQDLRLHDDALASYERALACMPTHAASHWNESLCRLQMGDFGHGLEKYEWRWKTEQKNDVRNFSQPLWLGRESLAGTTILLHAEQGLGDTLLFCRYVPLVSGLGATVVLEVQSPLKSLLATLEGVSRILAKGEPPPAFDFHCPLASLPLAFRTELGKIPAASAYVGCDPRSVARSRRSLGRGTLPNVGIVWKGANAKRAMPVAEMLKVVSHRAQFVSLQADPSDDEKALLDAHGIRQLSIGARNFSDAPLVQSMDLIITVDTSMAHLAGAMGRPVWVLLSPNPDFRWLLNRADSPWYPSARLFRADFPGDWGSAVDRVKVALDAELPALQARAAVAQPSGLGALSHWLTTWRRR